MKLVDLRRPSRGKRIMIYFGTDKILTYFSNDILDALKPYAQQGERSGFLELSAWVLLALLSSDEKKLESAADHLAVSCETLDDLKQLAQDCGCLGLKLWQRFDAASGE